MQHYRYETSLPYSIRGDEPDNRKPELSSPGSREVQYLALSIAVTESKEPDLFCVKSSVETVGNNLKKGAVVVLESTVYPGVTQDLVMPILEKSSRYPYR